MSSTGGESMMDKVWVIPWYREQDWPEWRSLCDFEGSHKEWLARAEAGTRQPERLGWTVARVIIEPQKFLAWSRTRRGMVESDDRMAYALSICAAREGAGNGVA
jgi:hypothetical protein